MVRRRQVGTGSVFRRASDGAWIAQLSKGPRGARKTTSRSARSRSEALAKLAQLRAEAAAGTASPTMTCGSYLERWVRDARNIRPATRHSYEAAVRTHLVPELGALTLSRLAPADVEAALARLSEHLTPRTLRNAHAVLRRALGQAVRAGLVTRNVAAREFVDAPRVPLTEPRALTEAEVARLLAAARGDRLEALVVVALGTGLRQGEILGLAWEDIEPDAIAVRYDLAYVGGRYVRDELKTERSRRRVPLAPSVRAALDAHRARMKAEGFVPVPGGPVFVNRSGGALSGSWVTHHLYRLLERAGVPRIPFKNLRTTFASRLYASGVADPTVAALLGHARTTTTRRHYLTVEPATVAAAIDRLVGTKEATG